jgi:hypothetical protein
LIEFILVIIVCFAIIFVYSNPQPFVSYLHDDDATDEDSDDDEVFHRVALTPRLKQHTSRLQDPAFIEGVNHLRKTPINLGLKQFDRNTPNRILQVAMENTQSDFCGFTPETQSVSAKNNEVFKTKEALEKEKLQNSMQLFCLCLITFFLIK